MAESILQSEKECYITGQTNNLHKHHIFFGHGLRQISEDNGFWVYLSWYLHNGSNEAVHGKNGHDLDLMLKETAQRIFEKTHSREEFMKLIGKSYL